MQDPSGPSRRIKILVLGEPGVGKTEFLQMICNLGDEEGDEAEEDNRGGFFTSPRRKQRPIAGTHTELTRPWTLGCTLFVRVQNFQALDPSLQSIQADQPVRVPVEFWDVGGTRTYSPIRNIFYQDFHGVILVYDVTNLKSHTNLSSWMMELCTRTVPPSQAFWGNHQKETQRQQGLVEDPNTADALLSGTIPVLLVANKYETFGITPPSGAPPGGGGQGQRGPQTGKGTRVAPQGDFPCSSSSSYVGVQGEGGGGRVRAPSPRRYGSSGSVSLPSQGDRERDGHTHANARVNAVGVPSGRRESEIRPKSRLPPVTPFMDRVFGSFGWYINRRWEERVEESERQALAVRICKLLDASPLMVASAREKIFSPRVLEDFLQRAFAFYVRYSCAY